MSQKNQTAPSQRPAPRHLELSRLRYFHAVAQTGNISRAARALGITQPSLTVALRRFEAELGASLFDRSHRGVTLTAAGEVLLGHVKDIFTRVELAAEQVRHLEDDLAGEFTLGCHESLGAYFLPGFLREFLAASPRIQVLLSNGPSAQVRERVLAREIHFGLAVNPPPHPELVMVKLFRDAYDFFVARAHAPAGVEEARARLREGPLIHAERILQSHELAERLAAMGLYPVRVLRCGDLELVKSLALAGLGVAMLPRRVAAYNQPGKLLRLHKSLPFVPDTIQLLYRADRHRTRAAERLKDALVQYGRGLDATYEA